MFHFHIDATTQFPQELNSSFFSVYLAMGIGCFRDTGRRAIPTLEGKSRLLRGNYRRRLYAFQKCASAAMKRGMRMFALQHGGWCASSRRAHLTFAKYGKSKKCRRNGKGGPWANNVYILRGMNTVEQSWGNTTKPVEDLVSHKRSLSFNRIFPNYLFASFSKRVLVLILSYEN